MRPIIKSYHQEQCAGEKEIAGLLGWELSVILSLGMRVENSTTLPRPGILALSSIDLLSPTPITFLV